jgi:ankyrin repeat protein
MQHILTAFSSKAEIMRLLLELGADVTAKDEAQSTPLHMASSSGIPDLVQVLIEHGADANRQDLSRRTPLHLASSCVSAKITFCFIDSAEDLCKWTGRRNVAQCGCRYDRGHREAID